MKYIKNFLKGLVGLLLFIVLLAYVTDHEYILKGVRVVYLTGHTTAYIDDYPHFENMEIATGTPQPWPEHQDYNTIKATDTLAEYHKATGTAAFVVIKNDSVWHEWYDEGFSNTSRTNSFSMAKSITTAMLGKAITDGDIKNLDQPLSDFYPEFSGAATTVGDLSSMASGLNWEESYTSPFSVTARAYYDDDLAETMLDLEITDKPGERFEYLSGNTQLLGMVVEKATGQKMANYLSDKFWKPMGFENTGLWQVDDAEHKLAKSYCCIATSARDFARFGKLFKDNGRWNGEQIIDSAFVQTATHRRFEKDPEYGYGFWLSDHLGKEIFVMRGILGQYVITIPEDNLIIVRLGKSTAGWDETDRPFTKDFYAYVDQTYTMMKEASR